MPIQFDCENCQKKLKVPESAAGKRGRCNQCGHLNTIPAVASAEAAPAKSEGAAAGAGPVTQPIGSASAAATYNVKSAVNGAVFGPADSATLKEWLDEDRITPNCQLQETGSQAWTPASAMFPTLGAAAVTAAASGGATDQYSQFKKNIEAKGNSDELNPYAPALSPHVPSGPKVRREIVPTSGDIGFCISHGWQIWKENFGLLLAVSATVLGVNYAMQFLQALVQGGLAAAGDMWVMGGGIAVVVLISSIIQMWLGLGSTKLMCNLCRGERAEYGMLFGSAKRLPLLLLLLLLAYLPFVIVGGGIFALVGPQGFQQGDEAGMVILIAVMGCLLIFAMVMFTVWPVYYLLADTDLGFGELISTGFSVGLKNCLIAIPIFFVAGLAGMMGIFACGVGIIATIPLGQAMVTAAYLNMSGQLAQRPASA